MATVVWRSNPRIRAEVRDYLFAGTWEATDIITLTMGAVTVSVTAGSTVIATVVATVFAAWNALATADYPSFAKITASASGDNLRLTMDSTYAGEPIKCTVATTETGGGAADAQTIDGAATSTGTASTANRGPYDWNTPENWSTGIVPVATDTVIFDGGSLEPVYYGLDQNGIALTALTILASYSGTAPSGLAAGIGLPKVNEDVSNYTYAEHQPDYLAIRPGTLRIGDGPGSGCGRLKIDYGSAAAATIVVRNTGTSREEDGVPCLLLKGSHASSAVTIEAGDVGVAFHAGETSDLTGGLTIGRSGLLGTVTATPQVYLGSGCTIVTANVDSGTVWGQAAVTTLNLRGGIYHHAQGAITTVSMTTGSLFYPSTSAATTVSIESGAATINAAITTLTLGDLAPSVKVTGAITTANVNSGGLEAYSTIGTGNYNGGSVVSRGAVTTLTVYAGVHWHESGNVDVLVMHGGRLNYRALSTLGGNPIVAGDAVLDFSKSTVAKTVTNPIEVHGGRSRVIDTNKSVATLVLDLNNDVLDSARFPIGTNIRLTRGTPA